MNEFLNWAVLGTYAGAVLFVALVTQLTKGIGVIDRMPTRLWSYIVALVVLLAAALVSGAAGLADYLLCPVNAVVVALAAQGGYDVVHKK